MQNGSLFSYIFIIAQILINVKFSLAGGTSFAAKGSKRKLREEPKFRKQPRSLGPTGQRVARAKISERAKIREKQKFDKK